MAIESTIEKLRKTLISSYQFVGTVASVNTAEGTIVITTPEGGSMKVKGAGGAGYNAGDKVIIKDGLIISKAPIASYYSFDV